MHERMAVVLDEAFDRIRAIQDGARAVPARRADAAELADDRPAQPQGLDRPEGGRRPEDRGLLALASGAAVRASPTIPSI